jgi:hypothetical protein
MHLADAVRTPEVVLFSGTDYEEQWQPRATRSRLLRRKTSCHPCYLFECPIGQPCLDISPEEVIEEVEALFAEGSFQSEFQSAPQDTRERYPGMASEPSMVAQAGSLQLDGRGDV